MDLRRVMKLMESPRLLRANLTRFHPQGKMRGARKAEGVQKATAGPTNRAHSLAVIALDAVGGLHYPRLWRNW